MKNDQHISSQPNNVGFAQFIFTSLLTPQKQADLSHLSSNCPGHNVSTQMCINKKCPQRVPFVCSDMECSCQGLHEQCLKANLRFIVKKLSAKINQSDTIKHEIEAIFDKMIDSLSELRDKVISEIQFKFKYANMHNLEYAFLKGLEAKEFPESLVGQSQTIWKLLTELAPQKPDCFDVLKEKINELQVSIDEKQGKILAYVNSQITKLQKEGCLFGESALGLGEVENMRKLEGLFSKKIRNATLLFRASQHQFEMSKFYELCGLQKNIMVVCETNQNRVIGGFTPLSFKGQQTDSYIEDPSQQTFIFSLTHNDKFRMKTKGNAIYRVSGQERICFGGCEFEICNQADKVSKCRSYSLNYYFQNDRYESNKKESFERFNGNATQYFTVREWEVWRVDREDA